MGIKLLCSISLTVFLIGCKLLPAQNSFFVPFGSGYLAIKETMEKKVGTLDFRSEEPNKKIISLSRKDLKVSYHFYQDKLYWITDERKMFSKPHIKDTKAYVMSFMDDIGKTETVKGKPQSKHYVSENRKYKYEFIASEKIDADGKKHTLLWLSGLSRKFQPADEITMYP